ncbi:MAG: glycosyltransferase family 4 protein [Desulfohalobiaceae bacterium]
MQVLYCITRSDTIGGAHVHVADMAAWLRGRGNEAMVLVGGQGPYCEYLASKGIPYEVCRSLCRPIHPGKDLSAILEIRSKLKKLQPEIISLHSAKAGILGRLACVGLNIPVLFTAHGWSFTDGIPAPKARLYRCLERLCAPLAQHIITVSHFDKSIGLQAGLAAESKLTAIHNCMPDIGIQASPEIAHGRVRIAMVARLDEQKDHSTLLKALAAVQGDWSLDLAGDGPKQEQIQNQAKELGLADRIRFLGLRKDIPRVLAEANIFVLITNWEGFPRSILEAMRAGLPVIASNVGGISEAVQEGETGYLVPRGNAQVLADRLSRLINSPASRLRMGKAGRLRFQEEFLFERMASRTFKLYQELIQQQ